MVALAAHASDAALARSILWQAVALGFQPPDGALRASLCSPEGMGALERAADAACPVLLPLLAELRRRPRPTEGEHVAMFGHTLRGAVSPYEMEWGPEALFGKPHDMADIGAVLRAFGLALEPGRRERVDHVSCQAELLAFLAVREAVALESGDALVVAEVHKAERLILGDHVGRFLPALGESMALAQPDGFLGAFGRMAAALTRAECERVGVPSGSAGLTLRPTDLDDRPYGCESGADLVQVETPLASGRAG
jgi:TorA maturation chaperone TorD